MATPHKSDVPLLTEICVDVTHAGRKTLLKFPAATATIGDVKDELLRHSGVPREKQRLLFGGAVRKDRRHEGRDDVRLLDLLARPAAASANGSSTVTIPLMLIGSVAAVPHINEKAVAQLHRLVSTTVEHESSWFRCSYSKGYARQTAFVCRTCVKNGWCNPAHAICYACAEVCHFSHDVEEWGVRYFMRCDCCTAACWKNSDMMAEECEEGGGGGGLLAAAKGKDEPRRCCFLVDSETGLPPSTSVVPMNSKNRYPRSHFAWCYCDCEDNHPVDDLDAGGVVCMLCTTCFWSSHMTRLCTDMLCRLPCYGDVVEGSVVVFRCRTCDTLVCPPCYFCCHKDHDLDPTPINPSQDNCTNNETTEDIVFSCGCRGCCSIAEEVPVEIVNSPVRRLSISQNIATTIMDNDSFMGFICAHCMQENPWLVENDPRHCYNGQLPEKVPMEQHKRVAACGFPADADCSSDDIYPFHGMLFPVNAFTEEMTCKCAPCREAFGIFAPRTTAIAITDMMIPLHDSCDHCGATIKDEQAFMCQTCELQQNRTFCVCRRCNRLRLLSEHPGLGSEAYDSNNNNTQANNNNNNETVETETNAITSEVVLPWDHPTTHVFVEDTYENLYTLCGMQLMCNLDPESREYVLENLEETSASFEGVVRHTIGETPLLFDPSEIAQHHQQLLQQDQKAKKVVGNVNNSTLMLGAKKPRSEKCQKEEETEGLERQRSKKERK